MKKLLSTIIALMLLALSCSALAEEPVIAPLLESAQILLFDTENVTLSGHADFFLNGERFKTADILYKQDGDNSHWQLDLKTPRKYRADQETGYTVIANGEKIFVMERYYPGTYSSGSDQPNNTLLRSSTRTNLLFSFLLSAADQMQALLPEGAVSVTRTETASEFRFTLTKDTTPVLVNTSLNMLADFVLKRFMGVDFDSIRQWGQGHLADYVTITQGILYSTDSFVLGDTSVTVTEDADGRITGASGTVTVLLCSEELSMVPLEIVFDLKVSDYGSTKVKEFNPLDFDVVSRDTVLKPAEKPVDEELSVKLANHAEELLIAAGYDTAPLATVEVTTFSGIIYVSSPLNEFFSVAAGMNENGDLLSLSDGSEEYYMASPHEPKADRLPQETAETLLAFLGDAFPELSAKAADCSLDLEYDYDDVTYQHISVLDENGEDTGIIFVIRNDPSLKIVYYTCMNE